VGVEPAPIRLRHQSSLAKGFQIEVELLQGRGRWVIGVMADSAAEWTLMRIGEYDTEAIEGWSPASCHGAAP